MSRSSRFSCWVVLCTTFALGSAAARLTAQTPFLTYNHNDAGLGHTSDWVYPESIDLCEVVPGTGAPLLIPVGGPEEGWEIDGGLGVTTGHVVLQNDSTDLDTDGDAVTDTPLGLCVYSMRPTSVGSPGNKFPARPRHYKVRARFLLEMEPTIDPDSGLERDWYANEFILFFRTIVGVNDVTFDTHHERNYVATFIPRGVLEREADFNAFPEIFDGAAALLEFGSCHGLIPHSDWPGARPDLGADWATAVPPAPIEPDTWNWVEVSVQGNDDGGPVLIQTRTWPDGDPYPTDPLIRAWDVDGFAHNADTRNAANSIEIGFGTSWHLRANDDHQREQFGKRTRVDDVTVTALTGCSQAPVTVTRDLWGDPTVIEGESAALYDETSQYEVRLVLSDRRAAGACSAATSVTVHETVPASWAVSNISNSGTFDADKSTITWSNLAISSGTLPTLTYRVTPPEAGPIKNSFSGELTEPGSEYYFFLKGDRAAVRSENALPVSDFGAIQHWLILGPYEQCGAAAPGEELMRRDYLTDGTITELEVMPVTGQTINTNYRTLSEGEVCTDPQEPGEAASLSLLANSFGRNPGGVPTWLAWRGVDDDDERIHMETVYGELDGMMPYAFTYLDVLEDTVIHLGVSSDDAVQLLLDGVEIHINNSARGSPSAGYQDTPFTHPGLGNIALGRGPHDLTVKIFEGGGDHNFRVGFLDENGLEIPYGPAEVEISLTPTPNRFTRGDCNGDGEDNISDAIFSLLFQFQGGSAPPCRAACDANRDGAVNITDPIFHLDFQFKGGPAPPAPYPGCDGAPVTDCATYICS